MARLNLLAILIFCSVSVLTMEQQVTQVCTEKNILLTRHALVRMQQRGIFLEQVNEVLKNGRMVQAKVDHENHLCVHKYTYNDLVVVAHPWTKVILTVYRNLRKGVVPTWLNKVHSEREKIVRHLQHENFQGDDLMRYYYKLCEKSRDISKRKARDFKFKNR